MNTLSPTLTRVAAGLGLAGAVAVAGAGLADAAPLPAGTPSAVSAGTSP